MKQSEREHLKTNLVADAVSAAAQGFDQHRVQYLAIGGAVLAVLVAIGGYVTWQRNKDAVVSGLLAEAMVAYEAPVQAPAPPGMEGGVGVPAQAPGTYPTEKAKLEVALPKFLAAAESAPASTPGRLARLNAAAVLVALGRFEEAKTHYTQVADGSDIVARGAALGKAQAEMRAGQYDAAIDGLKALRADATTAMPVDGVLMELARAYRGSGKLDDARKTLTEIVEKHAESPFAAEARAELDKFES